MKWTVLSVTFLLGGVLVVPYFFPPSQQVLSASSLAGFNNSLAYVCYAIGLALSAIALVRLPGGGMPFPRVVAGRTLFPVPPPLVLTVMAGHVALFAAIYLRQRGFFLAEALYFEDAAYRVQAGAVPFVDFAFFYGPLLLYPTVLMSRLVGLLPGYAVTFVLEYLASLYLLFVLAAALIADRRTAAIWFTLFAVGLFNPYLGLNYTLLRFTLPAVALLGAWRYQQGPTTPRFFGAVVLFVLAFLCSPDIGVVTIAAAGCLAFVAALHPGAGSRVATLWPVVAVSAASLLLSGALLVLIDGTLRPVFAYLRPVVTFAAGGWNTQIDPSVPMLTLFGFSILVAAWLWNSWRRSDFQDQRPLIAAYAVLCLLMQRASFGKADVVHVAYSGLPVYLAAAACGVRGRESSKRQWQVAAVFAVGVILPLQFYHAMLFAPSLLPRMASVRAAASTTPSPSPATKQEIQNSLARAVEHFGPERLYYMHRLEYYRLPVYLDYNLKPFMFHPTLAAAFTADDIRYVIEQLRGNPAVVLARRADLSPEPPPPYVTNWAYYITSSPLPGSTVFNLTLGFQWRLEQPLVRFLAEEFVQEFEDGEIVGMVARDDSIRSTRALQ